MSSDPAWISFTNLLRGSDKEIMMEDEEDVEESLTPKLTSRAGCHEMFWPHDSNAIFEG